MNILYLRIKELAEEKNLSNAQIERDLDFSNGLISTWKTKAASSDRLLKLAKYFNVSVDYLLGKTDIREKGDTGEYFRLNTKGLNEEEVADLKEQLKFAEELALRKLKGGN